MSRPPPTPEQRTILANLGLSQRQVHEVQATFEQAEALYNRGHELLKPALSRMGMVSAQDLEQITPLIPDSVARAAIWSHIHSREGAEKLGKEE